MIRLRKAIQWVLNSFFGVIVLGLLLGITSNCISPWLRGRELMIFEEIIGLCRSHWTVLTLLVAIIFILCAYDWVREKKAEFKKIWTICKPVKKLTPEGDFKIQKYNEAYIHRESNGIIENLLKNGEYILVTGKPKIGKTRASYEAIEKLENFSVIKPRPEEIEIEKIKIPPLSNKNFILFLDDLQRFVDKNIKDVIDRLKKKSKKLIVVATSRTGKELDLVKKELPSLYREFTNIELEEISEEDGRGLAKLAGLHLERFDGTPGTIILDMNDMIERYKEAGDGQSILKSLKLLREGNLFVYRKLRVKDVCRDIFDLSDEMLGRSKWDGIITDLRKNGFITKDEDIIDIYPSYLDECCDYNPILRDLTRLKNILIRMGDSGSLFYLGNSFLYKEDFSHAKDCYIDALKIYPKYASARNSLGYVLTKLGEAEEAKGRYDKAEKLYEETGEEHRRAIGSNPYYAMSHNNLGYALTKLGEIKEIKGEYNEAKRLYEKAEGDHRKAIRLKPGYTAAHHSLAYALRKLERYGEAEEEYREAIRLNPETPFSHNLLGYLLANKLGRNEEAEEEYREAIRLNPDYPSARNNLGYLLAKLRRWKEAENEYRDAIKVAPEYIIAYHNLGHLLVELRRYGEAEQKYREALKINPDYVGVHNALGYVLVKLKRYDVAETEFRTAIRLKPDFAEAHRNFGYMLVILGKDKDEEGRYDEAKELYDEAEKEYIKSLQINSDDEGTLTNFAVLLEILKRNKEAEDCHKRSIERNPNSVKACNTYGHFLFDRGRYEETKKVCRKVLGINPKDVLAHKIFGRSQEKLGDIAQCEEDKLKLYEEAEKEFKKAIDIHPSYPAAHRHLANLLAKLGRYKEAENEYKEAKNVAYNYPKNNRDFGIFLSKIRRKREAKKELGLSIKLFKQKGNEKEAEKIRELLNNL